jgi:hypothetical protein
MTIVELAVSRRPRTAKARVRIRGGLRVICGVQGDILTSYPLITSVCNVIPPTLYSHISLTF